MILRCQGWITARIVQVKKQDSERAGRVKDTQLLAERDGIQTPTHRVFCSPATALLLLCHSAAPLNHWPPAISSLSPSPSGISLSLSNSLSPSHTHILSLCLEIPTPEVEHLEGLLGLSLPRPDCCPRLQLLLRSHSASNAKKLFSSTLVNMLLFTHEFVHLFI